MNPAPSTADVADLARDLELLDTATLKQMRAARKDQMERLQARGWWEVADHYHAAWIAPINVELEKRGEW